MFYGPPGCGKTLGARRVAYNTGLPLIKVKFDTMLSSYFGESASNLRSIFEECEQSPSVLLLDECDFIARARKGSKDVGEVPRIVNTLLQLLEDYDLPGLVIATTNIQEELDPVQRKAPCGAEEELCLDRLPEVLPKKSTVRSNN